MSAGRDWPEGVPPLPPPPYCRYVSGWEFLRRPDQWTLLNPCSLRAANLWINEKDDYPKPCPRVVRCGDRITHANAAARALGIVPDEEMESEA